MSGQNLNPESGYVTITVLMLLADHLTADDPNELEQILRSDDYPLYIKTLRTPEGTYYFRVHNAQNRVVARSPAFPGKQERDTAYEAFIDFVEIEIHNRRQRRFNFGF